jgi:phospholipase C
MMQENHSFDNYFGTFPGVIDGYTQNTCIIQNGYPGCIKPFHITTSDEMKDPDHSWNALHREYANGTNSGFYAADGTLPFGYYTQSDIPYYWSLAQNYTLLDNYFCSSLGPTLPNHFFLVAAQTGGEIGDDQHLYGLHGSYNLNMPTIFSELTDHQITWNSYSWLNPVNWNPAAFIPSVAANTTLYSHVKQPTDFFTDLSHGKLAQVSWVMPPSDGESDHPPYMLSSGENWVKSVVTAVQASPYWNSTAIFLTWDENGGYYDLIPPVQTDAFGYGFRVPMIVISPYAKHGFVDHSLADHTSTLAFIEHNFGLRSLTLRDARANDLMWAFTFGAAQPLHSLSPVGAAQVLGTVISQTYVNNQGQTVNASLYSVLRNAKGQIVYISSTSFSLAAGESTVTYLDQTGVPVGTYNATIFAISPRHVPLSRETSQMVQLDASGYFS